MKKVSPLLAAILLLIACGGGVSKYKSMVEELSSKWGETTTALTEFSNSLSKERAGLITLSNGLKVDDAILSKWDEATTVKYNNIKAIVQNNSNKLGALTDAVDDFVSNTWVEKAKVLQSLKDGLAAGKMPDGAADNIQLLTNLAAEANNKLAAWKEQFGQVKSGVADAQNMLNQFKSEHPF